MAALLDRSYFVWYNKAGRQPTSPRYRLRNYTQLIGGALLRSPAYDADVYLQDNDCDALRSRIACPDAGCKTCH